MTRDELIEEAARIIQHWHVARNITLCSHDTARKIADLFFDELKEPTRQMVRAYETKLSFSAKDNWQAMLSASPLAPNNKENK